MCKRLGGHTREREFEISSTLVPFYPGSILFILNDGNKGQERKSCTRVEITDLFNAHARIQTKMRVRES